MRLATWNCQSGLSSKWDHLERLAADVLTVQECGATTRDEALVVGGWTCSWSPGGRLKGLAVLARSPFRIESEEIREPFAVSTIIDGPARFRFVGFWAMSPKGVGYTSTRQASRLIEALPDDGLPAVVAGDFNADRSAAHLANVRLLADLGLVSAYHVLHGVGHGAEADPTHYFLRRPTRPFHVDFVFVPRRWRIERVEIGSFDDDPGRRLSDHVPVLATVTPRPPGPPHRALRPRAHRG